MSTEKEVLLTCRDCGSSSLSADQRLLEKQVREFRLGIGSDVLALVFIVFGCWFMTYAGILLIENDLDQQRSDRQQQRIEQLQKLLDGTQSPATPSEQSQPDSSPQLDLYRSRGPMRVYLSARFQRQEEMRRYADQLRAESVEVVSAWHDIDSPSVDGFTGLDNQRRAWLAMLDLQQLSGTNVIAVFTNSHSEVVKRKGREIVSPLIDFRHVHNVDFGLALALGKRILLIGEGENGYHYLPDVEHFPVWADAFGRILELRGTDAMTTRQAAKEVGTTVQQIGMWIRDGRLPAAKRNGRYVVGRNDVDRVKAQYLRSKADALSAVNSDRLFPFKA